MSKYFVSFGEMHAVCGGPYYLNSVEVEIDDTDLSQGMLAEKLEVEVSKIQNNMSVVILNFWKL